MTSGESSASQKTPLADAVLQDPLAVPVGVTEWLRDWEAKLRAARASVAVASEQAPWLNILEECRAELDILIDNDRLSAFRRLLRRPLGQLVEGSIPRRSFDRLAADVLDRAQAASEISPVAKRCLAKLADLEYAYSQRLPSRMRELVARFRIRREDIARLRRAQDAAELESRFSRVERRLSRLSGLIGQEQPRSETVAGETLAHSELRLALELRLRERNALRQIEGAGPAERMRLGSHLDALARLPHNSAISAGRPTAGSVMLEGTLDRVRRVSESVPYGWGDGPLWVGAIAAANAHRFGTPGRFAWIPVSTQSGGGVRSHSEEDAAIAMHVIPLGDELAYISRNVRSAVRLWSATTELGRVVDAQVAADDVAREHPAVIASDLKLLFDGFDDRQSHWYESRRRAKLRLIATDESGWFARIVRRGELEILDRPAWLTEASEAAFRVLQPPERLRGRRGGAASSASVVEVAVLGSTPVATFLGFATWDVRTGLLEHERAWLRTTTHRWHGAAEAIRREAELFRRMMRHRGSRTLGTLRWLASARIPGEQSRHPLYGLPTAYLAKDLGALGRSLSEDPAALTAIFRAVARVFRTAHACDFTVGACHLGAFAYGVDWQRDPLVPEPTVVLIHAPCATPIGEKYLPAIPAAGGPIPRYRVLGVPIVTSAVEGQQPARPEHDMMALGGFMLDLLLDEPSGYGATHWYDLLSTRRSVTGMAGSRYGELAMAVLKAMRDEDGHRRLLRMCDGIVERLPTNLAEIRGLLE